MGLIIDQGIAYGGNTGLTSADKISYSDSTSQLGADNVQTAIDNTNTKLSQKATVANNDVYFWIGKTATANHLSVSYDNKQMYAQFENGSSLTFDAQTNYATEPISGSGLPITSSGVYTALTNLIKIVNLSTEMTISGNSYTNYNFTFTQTGYDILTIMPYIQSSNGYPWFRLSVTYIDTGNVRVTGYNHSSSAFTNTVGCRIVLIKSGMHV